MGSFFKKIEGWFGKFFSKAPTVLQKVSSVLKFLAPLLNFVMAQAEPKDAPAIHNIVSEAQSDLSLASSLVSEYHSASPLPATAMAQINTGVSGLAENLKALLDAGHIKDANLKNQIELGVGELQAVLGQLTAPAGS